MFSKNSNYKNNWKKKKENGFKEDFGKCPKKNLEVKIKKKNNAYEIFCFGFIFTITGVGYILEF